MKYICLQDALELSSCVSSNSQVLQQNVTEVTQWEDGHLTSFIYFLSQLYSHQPRQESLKKAIENIGKYFYEKYHAMKNNKE